MMQVFSVTLAYHTLEEGEIHAGEVPLEEAHVRVHWDRLTAAGPRDVHTSSMWHSNEFECPLGVSSEENETMTLWLRKRMTRLRGGGEHFVL